MIKDTLVAISYCAEHIKSTGSICALEHTMMLKTVVDQFADIYPVLVAATGWTIIDIPEDDVRLLTWEIFKKTRVTSLRHNPAHQYGACWCLQQAFEYATIMGYEYIMALSDDIVIHPQEVQTVLDRLRQGFDYVGDHWGSDTRTLNTQVFGCRVAAFYKNYIPEEFQRSGMILEAYMGIVAERSCLKRDIRPIVYLHTHEPALFFELSSRLTVLS
jgi:hypothetical protein